MITHKNLDTFLEMHLFKFCVPKLPDSNYFHNYGELPLIYKLDCLRCEDKLTLTVAKVQL